jgi:hypothetical protein
MNYDPRQEPKHHHQGVPIKSNNTTSTAGCFNRQDAPASMPQRKMSKGANHPASVSRQQITEPTNLHQRKSSSPPAKAVSTSSNHHPDHVRTVPEFVQSALNNNDPILVVLEKPDRRTRIGMVLKGTCVSIGVLLLLVICSCSCSCSCSCNCVLLNVFFNCCDPADIYICMYVYIYLCLYMYMCIYMYICMYMYITHIESACKPHHLQHLQK